MDNKEYAKQLNDHLSAGGDVYVTNHLKSIRYRKRHAGMFFAGQKGELRVKHGRGSVALSCAGSGLILNRIDLR